MPAHSPQPGFALVRGKVVRLDEASISLLDRSILYGDMVFTTVVGFHKTVLNLEPHLERLRRHATELLIPFPWSNQELAFDVTSLLDLVHEDKVQIRILVSRGLNGGLKPLPNLAPEKYVIVTPSTSPVMSGLAVQPKPGMALARGEHLKLGNYPYTVKALLEAQAAGFDDILWVNQDGEITEGSTSNIFLLARHGDELEIITPPVYSGILKGTTRDLLMELLYKAKIPVTEQIVLVDEIPRFDEAFFTSSIQGLRPIKSIGKHRLHTERPHATFKHIERLFLTWVESIIGFRVEWQSGKPV